MGEFRITYVSFYNPSRIEGLCWNSEFQSGVLSCNRESLGSYVITISISEWVRIIFYTLLQPFLRLRGCPGLSKYNFPIVLFETEALISMFRNTFSSFYNPSRIEGLCWFSELQPGDSYLIFLDPLIAWP